MKFSDLQASTDPDAIKLAKEITRHRQGVQEVVDHLATHDVPAERRKMWEKFLLVNQALEQALTTGSDEDRELFSKLNDLRRQGDL